MFTEDELIEQPAINLFSDIEEIRGGPSESRMA